MGKHPTDVPGYSSLSDLAERVGNLRYDKLLEFVQALTADVRKQANKDHLAGKTQLATALDETASKLAEVEIPLTRATQIALRHM